MEFANFDVRDRKHYVYEAVDEGEWKALQDKKEAEQKAASIVGTGRALDELIFPDESVRTLVARNSHLWAVRDGSRSEVKVAGESVRASGELALSPDGHYLVLEQPVPDVPKSWEALYPPFGSSANEIHAGKDTASEYVRINLQNGAVEPLTDAPAGESAGWRVGYDRTASWSKDGRAVLLQGTFINSKDNTPSRPCVAVVDLVSNTASCVEVLKGRNSTQVEEGYRNLESVQFLDGDKNRVLVSSFSRGGTWLSPETTQYQRSGDSTWKIIARTKGIPAYGHNGLEVTIKQSFSEPPLLVAARGSKSRVIWDPNPQLKDIEFPEISAYKWKDSKGREFNGGIYKPINYKLEQRYPLVIQTHGFDDNTFLPDGTDLGNFAAAELAMAGIVVLQAGEDCPTETPEEGPCAASAYESAANQLVADGLVDASKIGIIGFSRSCFYVMEALTTSSLHFKAASVTDGVMFDYLQFLTGTSGKNEIGALPIGEGLQRWMKRSPGFNLEKVHAPLMVVGEGPRSLLSMWQPYAVLHQLKKPVDLIVLHTDEHVITNPAMRLVAQGGTVDWFRFWLQGYEDPDPAKAEQYKRWRELQKMQMGNGSGPGRNLPK